MSKNKRIWELDFIRGVCIILMVMDHLFFSVGYLFRSAWLSSGNEWAINAISFIDEFFKSDLRSQGRPLVLWAFFFICGISNSFSRSNIKRGIQLVCVAYIITLGTYILEHRLGFFNVLIRFGVLHMLAVSILTWCIIDLISRDEYKTAVACLGLAIVILILNENMGFFTKNHVVSNDSYAFLHRDLLFSRQGDYSADYFPLIPHMAKFFIGAALGPILYKKRKTILPFLDKYQWYRPVNFLGRYTLVIFVLHQPVVTLLIALLSAWFITQGNFVIF